MNRSQRDRRGRRERPPRQVQVPVRYRDEKNQREGQPDDEPQPLNPEVGNPPCAQTRWPNRRGQQRVRLQPVHVQPELESTPIREYQSDNDMQLDESEDESMEIEQETAIQQPAQQPPAQAEMLTII